MHDVRIVNELRVLHVIRDSQPISRVRIAQLTGLHPSTVTLITKRLLERGMISEGPLGPSTGGRRPTYLFLNPEKMFLLGIDIGVRQTNYAVADFNGHHLLRYTLPTGGEPVECLRRVCADIRQRVGEAGLTPKLSAIGVSVPGMVDGADGSLIVAPNLGWERVPLCEQIQRQLGLPTFVENDASAAALAEILLGSVSLIDYSNVVYVLVVEGIGTSLIIDGHLYRGSRIGTGGFGHMQMDPAGPPCSCGGRGCWESLASERAIRWLYAELSAKEGSAHHEVKDVGQIVEDAVLGDELAARVLKESAKSLGLGILSLLHGLLPQAIIVGGNVARAWNIIGPVIEETVRSPLLISSLAAVNVMPSSVPCPPSLYGAVAVCLSNILEQEVGGSVLSHAAASNQVSP